MTPVETRVAIFHNGYIPIPANGKACHVKGWSTKTATNAEEIEVQSKQYRDHSNTGILTRDVPAIDIDITFQPAAEAVERHAKETFEERGDIAPVRIGQAPKRAILLRTDEPFEKLTRSYSAPDGGQHKIEILCNGQQVIVAGIHPDTGKPYSWHGGSPLTIRRDALAYVRREDVESFLDRATELLCRDFGFQLGGKTKGNGADHDGPHDRADWAALIGNIVAGRDLHDSTLKLAGAYIASGMDERGATRAIEALFLTSDTPRDERWKARFDDVGRCVRDVWAKHGNKNAAAKEPDAAPNGAAFGLASIDAGEDDWNVPPREWLLGNMFCREFVSSLIGDGGTGKTALRYAQYLSLAIGRSLTGEHVFRRCRVLIVSMEDNINELRRRIRATCMHHGIDQKELTGWLFYIALGSDAGKIMTVAIGRHVRGPLANKLEEEIKYRNIDLAALDPFVKTHAVEENSNGAIDSVMQILSDIAVKHSIAVDTPHHMSKGLPDPGNANRGRGASAMKDAARLVYTLSPMTKEEAAAMGVDDATSISLIRIDSAKVNIAPPMIEAKWFLLVGIRLGNCTGMYPNGDEVQTVEQWAPANPFDSVWTADINRILDEIEAAAASGERFSSHHNARSRAAWRVVVKHVPAKGEAQAKEIIKAWLKSGLLVEEEYRDEIRRQTAHGLIVDNAKRPSGVF